MEDKRKNNLKHDYWIGKQFSEEHKQKISSAMKGRKKNPESIAKRTETRKRNGFKHSEASLLKMKLSHIGQRMGELNNRWVGDDVKYCGLHAYVRRRLPQPKLCEFCNVKESKHLANITGLYNREIKNWKYLCVSCHRLYDYRVMGSHHV